MLTHTTFLSMIHIFADDVREIKSTTLENSLNKFFKREEAAPEIVDCETEDIHSAKIGEVVVSTEMSTPDMNQKKRTLTPKS